MTRYESWGKYPQAKQVGRRVGWSSDPFPAGDEDRTVLPHGMGRSYGDSCLNDGGCLLLTTTMNHIIALDQNAGLVRCEAGVAFADLLDIIVPKGWFLPVTPGTKFITVGGAIANDVHGKNHHVAGTFGCFVTRFELLRSNGDRIECEADEPEGLFQATIGGLGLTGLITWAEFRLQRIQNPFLDVENVRFQHLSAFFELARDADASFDYTVSWIDCLATGSRLGRGLLMRGNRTPGDRDLPASNSPRKLVMPFHAPAIALNSWTVKAFNALYYRKQWSTMVRQTVHYEPFFYPLDSILHWNRLYGKRGFFQHQCVVPPDNAEDVMTEILEVIAKSGQASFLAVLKLFGSKVSPGMLSFPRPGTTLALDFPNRGSKTLNLFEKVDAIVRSVDGAIYPAKDARMSGEDFRRAFPKWENFSKFIDPCFSSSFWRRVTESHNGDVP
jgi:FAD/FMN-containing dehydrogenase